MLVLFIAQKNHSRDKTILTQTFIYLTHRIYGTAMPQAIYENKYDITATCNTCDQNVHFFEFSINPKLGSNTRAKCFRCNAYRFMKITGRGKAIKEAYR